MVLFHTAVSAMGGLITVILAYIIWRRRAVSAWGWIASFFPDMPVFWLATLGATNLSGVLLVSHTLGVLVFPLFLIVLDILLIEVAWVRYITWLPYPKAMRRLERVESLVERLENYNAIPRPIRVVRVYAVGILAGIIHLILNILVGSF